MWEIHFPISENIRFFLHSSIYIAYRLCREHIRIKFTYIISKITNTNIYQLLPHYQIGRLQCAILLKYTCIFSIIVRSCTIQYIFAKNQYPIYNTIYIPYNLQANVIYRQHILCGFYWIGNGWDFGFCG